MLNDWRALQAGLLFAFLNFILIFYASTILFQKIHANYQALNFVKSTLIHVADTNA